MVLESFQTHLKRVVEMLGVLKMCELLRNRKILTSFPSPSTILQFISNYELPDVGAAIKAINALQYFKRCIPGEMFLVIEQCL